MLKNKILKTIKIGNLYYRSDNIMLMIALILLSYPIYASININVSPVTSKIGDSMMSNTILVEVLDNIDRQLRLEDQHILKETVYKNLPMQAIDGIGIKAHPSVDITQYNSAPLIILFGINEKSRAATPLFENTFIRWRNIKSNQHNEVALFDAHKNKIPPAQIPQPIAPVIASHHYIVEIVDLRSKLNLPWEASEYTIQIVNGNWTSNTVKIELFTQKE